MTAQYNQLCPKRSDPEDKFQALSSEFILLIAVEEKEKGLSGVDDSEGDESVAGLLMPVMWSQDSERVPPSIIKAKLI